MRFRSSPRDERGRRSSRLRASAVPCACNRSLTRRMWLGAVRNGPRTDGRRVFPASWHAGCETYGSNVLSSSDRHPSARHLPMILWALLFLILPPVALALASATTDGGAPGVREVFFCVFVLLFLHSLLVSLAGPKPFAGCWRKKIRGLLPRDGGLHHSARRRVQALRHPARNRGRAAAMVPSQPAPAARILPFARVPRAGLPWQAGPSRSDARNAPGPRMVWPSSGTAPGLRRSRAAR